MAKALWTSGTLKMGRFMFGKYGAGAGSVKQIVSDGDTVLLSTPDNISSRFLGIDAAEMGFNLRPTGNYVKIDNPKWDAFFTSGAWKTDITLTPDLQNHLEGRMAGGAMVAANHHKHAMAAQRKTEELIEADIAASGRTKESFAFFTSFGNEFMDGYGRLLCYLHADKDNWTPEQRKLSYNELLLVAGVVAPYFIFPNIQPFLAGSPFASAQVQPAGFWAAIAGAARLRAARTAVANARTNRSGIFDNADPLILLPYELRFLARSGSSGPDRFVIDLGPGNGNTILRPEKYYTVANVEDRLFIPKEYVPLFLQNGWTL